MRRGGGPFRRRARRAADLLLAVSVLALLALVVARWEDSPQGIIEGAAKVLDGDTLLIVGERVRLKGIDAPELEQSCHMGGMAHPCGGQARDELRKLIDGLAVSCNTAGRDAYRRLLAECSAGGANLNLRMIERGWAVSYGDYESVEKSARDAGVGLWSSDFDRPEDWRREHGSLLGDLGLAFGLWLEDFFGNEASH